MLCRTAGYIYWLSRYIERAENVARFVDVNQTLTLGAQGALSPQWAPLVYTTGDEEIFAELYCDGKCEPEHFSEENVLRFLTFDERNPNSILSCLSMARQNARGVRDNLPALTWEEINKFYLMVREAADRPHTLRQPYDFLDEVKRRSHLIGGVTHSTMSRNEGWHFYRIGRMLERADKTSRMLDVKYYVLLPDPSDVGTPLDVVQWSALLESTSALQMYRKRYGRIRPRKVARFLILDREFPRSMGYALLRAEQSMHAITGSPQGVYRNSAEQLLGRLTAELSYTSVDDVIENGMHQFIDGFQNRLNEIGVAVESNFFHVQQERG
ncbi:alpha-E domain-containing protein [Thalassoroseus pseudoceratinae]|uniref:alpha-E domain-containing protein n=1 Tax=Thalassoroseus pseudoceratinae TaxID=2713176 RepID=UPI001421370C|nr:alpha-E domain-containing protein [Thalassoroseus pseudoceratinae]